jgi:tryptophanyl-tRNA synthetase
MNKSVILTGLRANNDLTIGNYFGAMLPMIDMAKQKSAEYQINMFIPDLHSFTTPIDHSQLYDQILHNARLFVAAGLPLNNDDIHLYRQSYVSAHSELTWILDCFTGFGEMSRMTEFKDKSKKVGDERVSVGLFNYPVLMAADILLYNTQYVPVGDDQTQHLEYARDIAQRMNNRFGEIFTVPEPVTKQHELFGKDQGLRIMDLQNPAKKMSKSDESGKGVIFLGDDPEAAAKKIMSATTDEKGEIQFDRANQPGISNLLEILTLLRGSDLQQTIGEFEGQTRYGDFKQVVADEIKRFLTDFQAGLASVDEAVILGKLESSERAMNQVANATLLRTQQAIGLRPKGS